MAKKSSSKSKKKTVKARSANTTARKAPAKRAAKKKAKPAARAPRAARFRSMKVTGGEQALNNPERKVVAPRVRERIAIAAQGNGADPQKVNRLVNGDETLGLEADLNLNADLRTRLHLDYTDISNDYPNGKDVGPIAARNCDTVADAVVLTHKKANGQ